MDVLFRAANVVTTALLVCGVAAWFAQPGARRADHVLDAGLLLLMAVPVVQLVGAIRDEVRAKEWRFALVGLLVLFLLCGSGMVALAR